MEFTLHPKNDEQKRTNQVLWVRNLLSDEYQQGKGLLHYETPDGDKFCCLGVLCETAGIEGKRDVDGSYEYDGYSALPDSHYRAFRAVGIPNYSALCDLVAMNDDGKPFADIVNTKLRQLFGDDVVNDAINLLDEERGVLDN